MRTFVFKGIFRSVKDEILDPWRQQGAHVDVFADIFADFGQWRSTERQLEDLQLAYALLRPRGVAPQGPVYGMGHCRNSWEGHDPDTLPDDVFKFTYDCIMTEDGRPTHRAHAMVVQFLRMQRTWRMLEVAEQHDGAPYDLVVRLRPDMRPVDWPSLAEVARMLRRRRQWVVEDGVGGASWRGGAEEEEDGGEACIVREMYPELRLCADTFGICTRGGGGAFADSVAAEMTSGRWTDQARHPPCVRGPHIVGGKPAPADPFSPECLVYSTLENEGVALRKLDREAARWVRPCGDGIFGGYDCGLSDAKIVEMAGEFGVELKPSGGGV
ncbi:unnamed protein product [Pedinophyceae sp. YPF-701]|nr:unnamed protein product [Pedinophyceae sp. YPF-701]